MIKKVFIFATITAVLFANDVSQEAMPTPGTPMGQTHAQKQQTKPAAAKKHSKKKKTAKHKNTKTTKKTKKSQKAKAQKAPASY